MNEIIYKIIKFSDCLIECFFENGSAKFNSVKRRSFYFCWVPQRKVSLILLKINKNSQILLSFQTYEFSRKTWKYCDCLTECAEERRIIKSEGRLYAHFFCCECETFSVRYFKEKDDCFTCPVRLCAKSMSFDEFKERSCCFDAKFGDIKVYLTLI